MAASQQYTVTAAVPIASAPAGVANTPVGQVYLSNGAAVLYLGGPNVTAINGAPVAANATMNIYLWPGDVLYAFCATSSVIGVLQTGA